VITSRPGFWEHLRTRDEEFWEGVGRTLSWLIVVAGLQAFLLARLRIGPLAAATVTAVLSPVALVAAWPVVRSVGPGLFPARWARWASTISFALWLGGDRRPVVPVAR
jgi:hypothetical protein